MITGLCLRVDFSAVLFEDLGDVDLVLLCTQMHRRQSVLRLAVGGGAVVEQQTRYVCVSEWRRHVQWAVTVLHSTTTTVQAVPSQLHTR